MQFVKGQSGNPEGRKAGCRNRASMLAEKMLEGEAEGIVRAAIIKAMEGDPTAMRLCLDRFAPLRRDRTIALDLPPLKNAEDSVAAAATIAAAVADGSITPGEGGNCLAIVDSFLRAYENVDLERRISDLEAAQECERDQMR
jgi:hypothetical protein